MSSCGQNTHEQIPHMDLEFDHGFLVLEVAISCHSCWAIGLLVLAIPLENLGIPLESPLGNPL